MTNKTAPERIWISPYWGNKLPEDYYLIPKSECRDGKGTEYTRHDIHAAVVQEMDELRAEVERLKVRTEALRRRAQKSEGLVDRITAYLKLWRDGQKSDWWFRKHIDAALRGVRRNSGAFFEVEYSAVRRLLTTENEALKAERDQAIAASAAREIAMRDRAAEAYASGIRAIIDLQPSPDGQQALDVVRAKEWDAGRKIGRWYAQNPYRAQLSRSSDAGKSEDRG